MVKGMRKEYRHARLLALAQAQVLNAYDEIKMATTRLHIRESENDKSIDALSPNELASASVMNTSDKFLSLTSLSNIKGKLRYLKVLQKHLTEILYSPALFSLLLFGHHRLFLYSLMVECFSSGRMTHSFISFFLSWLFICFICISPSYINNKAHLLLLFLLVKLFSGVGTIQR